MAKSLSLSLPPSSLSVFHSQSSAYWENCKFELGSFLVSVFFVPRLESRVVVNARSLGHFFETCSFSVEAEERRGEERRAPKNRNRVIYPSFISRRMGQLLKNTESTDRPSCSAQPPWIGNGKRGARPRPEMNLFCGEKKTNLTLANSSKVARHLRSQECENAII